MYRYFEIKYRAMPKLCDENERDTECGWWEEKEKKKNNVLLACGISEELGLEDCLGKSNFRVARCAVERLAGITGKSWKERAPNQGKGKVPPKRAR